MNTDRTVARHANRVSASQSVAGGRELPGAASHHTSIAARLQHRGAGVRRKLVRDATTAARRRLRRGERILE